jgi:hypothetical protein
MNEYDHHSITLSGTVQLPEITKTIMQLEKDVSDLKGLAPVALRAQADIITLRAQLAEEMMGSQLLRTYIEYLNPADGKRPTRPISYADWIKLQSVSEKIIAARAAA